jgi:hypothetical protein
VRQVWLRECVRPGVERKLSKAWLDWQDASTGSKCAGLLSAALWGDQDDTVGREAAEGTGEFIVAPSQFEPLPGRRPLYRRPSAGTRQRIAAGTSCTASRLIIADRKIVGRLSAGIMRDRIAATANVLDRSSMVVAGREAAV